MQKMQKIKNISLLIIGSFIVGFILYRIFSVVSVEPKEEVLSKKESTIEVVPKAPKKELVPKDRIQDFDKNTPHSTLKKYGWSQNFYSRVELIQKNKNVKYKLSKKSLQNLRGINIKLVDVVFAVSKYINVRVVRGTRSQELQNYFYKKGLSQKDGYKKFSNHQFGNGIDMVPYLGDEIRRNTKRIRKIDMYQNTNDNTIRWAYFTGFVKAIALSELNTKIKSGMLWRTSPMSDLKRPLDENSLPDSNHFELVF